MKKIPPGLQKEKKTYQGERIWHQRAVVRIREDSQFLRFLLQAAFLLLCIWIGLEFYLFARWGASAGTDSFSPRPPGVEGFLPISALISLKYWLQTGIVNDIHPSGLFILLAVLASSLIVKKSFCSWICPVGTLSESLWMAGQKLFGKNFQPRPWVDNVLRSLKYLLLLFFVWSVGQMDVSSLRGFIYSPYNRMADVKMYLFFANISAFALWTIIILTLLSVFIKNFWCRYLCPYGALLGVISWLSPLKITRNKATCIDCELCTMACPANVKVHNAVRVRSDECTNCLRCVEACPVKGALDARVAFAHSRVPNWALGILIAAVFAGITGLAMLTGHWQNTISKEEYLKRFPRVSTPLYQHNRGEVPEYGPND